jgi:L-fucose isomerase-like protein
MQFGFIPIKSSFIKTEEELLNIAGKYFEALNQIGGIRLNEKELNHSFPVFYFIVTGGTERLLLDLRILRETKENNEPVFIIAHPTQNSLPASLEALARFQQDGILGEVFYLKNNNDEKVLAKITNTVNNLEVQNSLLASRIGLIGDPSDWLVASSPDPIVVKEAWGPKVIPIPMKEVTDRIKSIENKEVASTFEKHLSDVKHTIEPNQNDIENNVRVYLALKQIIAKYDLNAATIRCFDLVLGIKTTGCFGLAQLNDDGYIAGCEGDLVSTVGMLWAYKLLNQIPWMANPAQVDIENNSLWLAHCTVPKSIVENYDLRSHFESGIGVGLQGTFPKGLVTLLRIGGANMEKLWLAEGAIIGTGNSEHLCRTQVEIKLSNGNVSDLLTNPLGNHLILVKGHNADRLRNVWEMIMNK